MTTEVGDSEPLPYSRQAECSPSTFILASDKSYVKVLRRAVLLLLLSALPTVAGSDLIYATSWIDQYSGNNAPVSMLMTTLSYLLQAAGVWLLTSYQPHTMHSTGHPGIRWIARWTGIAAAGCLLLTGPASWFDIRRQTGLLPVGLVEFLCASVCRVGTLYLLWLVALDIPSRALATHCIWLICALTLTYIVYLIGQVDILAMIYAMLAWGALGSNPASSAVFYGLRNARFGCQAFSLWLAILLFLMYRALNRQLAALCERTR